MEEFRPSATAQRVAMKRAAHQLLDAPKVFDDPVALHIIGKENSSTLEAEPYRFEGSPLSPYLRAFVAARSRYAEDQLAAGIRRGVCQYVILGAGLDTFAYRNPYSQSVLRVFEVDHAGTQAWKRARLEEAGIVLPGQSHVRTGRLRKADPCRRPSGRRVRLAQMHVLFMARRDRILDDRGSDEDITFHCVDSGR